ncbi:uncharacterized protein EV420DRAFT_1498799 [Desarmillaria tabescens]|uniref:Uncharacterized protein n=1 Tax=Armillaria tabescens TaxID=1929756 RepID=A0AA39U3V3_ARMTA|nr:uncharacterized protein EV420DRAFT_1498799 [Desarmillaria tabescens]KAK0470174.1 hypothetical protein EV420DRAFT_1498799 [Desarmillaria tabescens]
MKSPYPALLVPIMSSTFICCLHNLTGTGRATPMPTSSLVYVFLIQLLLCFSLTEVLHGFPPG